MNADRWATIAGFGGALLVIGALIWVVGVGELTAALSTVRPDLLVVILVVATCWLVAWGLALRTVLDVLDAPISIPMSALVFAGAIFSNNVTPFGQAGGEPVSGYLISRASDSEYETGLAAIASVDALHFVPSLAYAAAGLTFVLAGAVQFGRNLAFAVTAVALLVVGIPVAVYFGWRYRYRLEAALVRAATPLFRTIGRLLPGREPPSVETVADRVEGFFGAIERVATSRRRLVEALGFSALGWLLQCCSLWLSLFALDHAVPFAAVLVAVPMGAIAGMTPLPGGLGGIEAVQVALLLSTTGVTGGVATAAVLVHRGATYWYPTVVGGGVAFALGTEDVR